MVKGVDPPKTRGIRKTGLARIAGYVVRPGDGLDHNLGVKDPDVFPRRPGPGDTVRQVTLGDQVIGIPEKDPGTGGGDFGHGRVSGLAGVSPASPDDLPASGNGGVVIGRGVIQGQDFLEQSPVGDLGVDRGQAVLDKMKMAGVRRNYNSNHTDRSTSKGPGEFKGRGPRLYKGDHKPTTGGRPGPLSGRRSDNRVGGRSPGRYICRASSSPGRNGPRR